MKNASRHDTLSISQPPRNGPMAVATPPKPDHAPTARARSSGWNTAERMARLPGTRRAAPTPCRARAAISTSTFGASPQSADAIVNPSRPMRNTRRRPKRSPSEPAEEHQRGERDEVGVEHPLEPGQVGVEVLARWPAAPR